jgi:SHO1 osmosensor
MESGYGHNGRSSFSVGRIIGDPFALATISIGFVSIPHRSHETLLTSSCTACLDYCLCEQHNIRHSRRLSQLCVVDAGFHAVFHCRRDRHCRFGCGKNLSCGGKCWRCGTIIQSALLTRVQIVGFLAAGLVFTTSSVNSLVYSSVAAFEAAAAGFILLSMIAVRANSLPIVRNASIATAPSHLPQFTPY